MKNQFVLFFLACSSVFLTSLYASGEIVAKVGDQNINAADVRPIIELLDPRERALLAEDPVALSQFVRSLILQQLLYKQALQDGYDKRPTVAERIERARQTAIAQGFLASVSAVPESFPSQKEIADFYEQNKAALMLPRQYRLAQIFISSPEGVEEVEAIQAKRKATDLRGQLESPKADFAVLAQEHSDERQSASKGGEIGLLPENMIQPEIREKIVGLKPGQISEVIRMPGGWHIIKVLEIQEPRLAGLEEVKEQIISRLRLQQEEINRENFLNALLQQNPVMINEIAFGELVGGKK